MNDCPESNVQPCHVPNTVILLEYEYLDEQQADEKLIHGDSNVLK